MKNWKGTKETRKTVCPKTVSPGSVLGNIREAVVAPAYYAFNVSSRGSGELFILLSRNV